MDEGWIATLADPAGPGLQLSLITQDATAPVVPEVSLEVDDVDAAYARAKGHRCGDYASTDGRTVGHAAPFRSGPGWIP